MTAATGAPARHAIPGPPAHPLLGNLREARRDPLAFYPAARRDYGDIVRFRSLGPLRWYLFSHPDDIDYVLRRNARNYHKGIFAASIVPLVGEGLLTSEGEVWRRQRRLEQPAFHRQRLAALAADMTAAAVATAEGWGEPARVGRPLDVAAEMSRLTLQIVGRALLGTDTSGAAATVAGALPATLEYTMYRAESVFPLPLRLPTPRNRRFLRARAALDRLVYGIIAERRRTGADGDDLLSMLLAARDAETGEAMTDRQLRDEVLTILLAGHETTAVALSWTWFLLSQHPEAEATLHAELARVLGGRAPTAADVPRLPYTRQVIEEAMRLYPPVWATGRQALGDDEVRGYRLPAGSPVVLSPWVTHRHPDFWERPDAFEPERFAPGRAAGRPHLAYFPFGGGQRQCIGNGFALLEAQLIVATLAQRYRLRPVPGHPIEPEPTVTLRPRHGLPMTLHERSAA